MSPLYSSQGRSAPHREVTENTLCYEGLKYSGFEWGAVQRDLIFSRKILLPASRLNIKSRKKKSDIG
jgi:hypothetical protein